MIGVAHRFHGYSSLSSVYQRGRTIRAQSVSLRFAQRATGRPYRVAVVVSRKVSKSAVRRNRVRRRIYEVVRHMDTDISPAIDLVFTVFDEHVADMQTDKLQAIIRQLIQQTAEH